MSTPKQLAAAEHVAAIEKAKPLTLSGISFRDFLLEHHRYPVIAVTGQSGVGKTTFTDLLIAHLEEAVGNDGSLRPPAVKKLTELPQMSPYLPIIKATSDGLSDRTLWEKNQELFRSLDEAIVTRAFLESQNSVVVMDFSIVQVLVYAYVKIHGKSGKKFERDFNASFAKLPKPDFVVHVGAKPETVLGRLERRGSYIDSQIVAVTDELHAFYDRNRRDILSEYYRDVPVIRVETDELDLVNDATAKTAATKRAVEETLRRMAA
ncbi:MAG: dNK protein [Patescibacteria group bacterium]|nr:dNK protein [Patescibacteria group bacterium]